MDQANYNLITTTLHHFRKIIENRNPKCEFTSLILVVELRCTILHVVLARSLFKLSQSKTIFFLDSLLLTIMFGLVCSEIFPNREFTLPDYTFLKTMQNIDIRKKKYFVKSLMKSKL